MIPNMPTIGVRFDIEKAGGGYGVACWKVFWQAINPEEIGVATLYEGDTAATLNRRENVFCIAVQSVNSDVNAKIKGALTRSEGFKRVCANPMFVEGSSCTAEPLPDAGRIDATGSLVGDAGASRSALGTVKRERMQTNSTVRDTAAPPRATPASERTRTLPTIVSFKDLSEFIKKRFAITESQYACWMTPEELCDIVERYAPLILVSIKEYSCPASEDMCQVRLFEKTPPGRGPIGFTGLYPFASGLHSFVADETSDPKYAAALPRIADVHGMYCFNFSRGGSSENREDEPFNPMKGIPPESLWPRLYERKRRFLDALTDTERASAMFCCECPYCSGAVELHATATGRVEYKCPKCTKVFNVQIE